MRRVQRYLTSREIERLKVIVAEKPPGLPTWFDAGTGLPMDPPETLEDFYRALPTTGAYRTRYMQLVQDEGYPPHVAAAKSVAEFGYP